MGEIKKKYKKIKKFFFKKTIKLKNIIQSIWIEWWTSLVLNANNQENWSLNANNHEN